ncbi:MAG: DsrE family protein [Verrucomicrobia bacterium]|nr:DsrE family protein [Kiritimatiellia bacterium]MCP5487100.1 DsrE family protein [Verrucomicrobiota bacterium]
MTDSSPSTPSEHLVYVVNKAGENPELALLPFMHAVGALAMDIQSTVVLMANGVWLAKKDYGRHIQFPDKPPLDELITHFLELGGRLLVCTPCAKARKLEQEDLFDGVEFLAAARFAEVALSANQVISY